MILKIQLKFYSYLKDAFKDAFKDLPQEMIEALCTILKVTKSKTMFPSDQALEKILYLASMNVMKKWTQRYRNWDKVLNQLINKLVHCILPTVANPPERISSVCCF